MGAGAASPDLFLILFLIRADLEVSGFLSRMPCSSSCHWSVSSRSTSLVTRGVAGTTSYCEIQGFSITWSMVGRSSGLVFRQSLIRFLHSVETFVHSGLGNSYWPDLILFFIPGDIG